ncbi:MAG: hypothetical protein C7K11_01950 [Candidatus Amulumruptor caecigallinarius]|nr:MAG: hypothetical protein C7K11_01950 [Candidatus Amulumruptor caecigallinarius]
MISFVYPGLLYLLLLIPAIVGLWYWARWSGKRKLRRFGHIAILSHLMPDASKYMGGIKLSVEMAALALMIVALARPVANNASAEGSNETVTSRGIELMVCLDVSNSMLASSTNNPSGQSRLNKAKNILEKIIDKMSNDKIGLIVFAGDAYTQLPITSDYISAKMFLSSINTGIVPTQGTAIGAAIDMAASSFTPDSDMPKAIVVITDAENFEDDAVGAAKSAEKSGIRVDVVGVGTPQGAPIPLNRQHTEFMRDDSGQEIITVLNEAMGEEIAKAGGGIYLNANIPSVVSDLDDNLNNLGDAEFTRRHHSPAAEQFNILAWLALVLVVVDIFILNRKIKWLTRYNFFSKH